MRIFMLACLIGCGGGDVVVDVHNAGRMCLHGTPPTTFPDPEPQTFAADEPITVRIELSACLSSSCDVDRAMSCTTRVDQTAIGVTSLAIWTDTSGTQGACTEDCGILATTCTIDPLAAGAYLVVFGNKTLDLTVPSETAEQPCVEADIGAEG